MAAKVQDGKTPSHNLAMLNLVDCFYFERQASIEKPNKLVDADAPDARPSCRSHSTFCADDTHEGHGGVKIITSIFSPTSGMRHFPRLQK
jgi:hypothetical protein